MITQLLSVCLKILIFIQEPSTLKLNIIFYQRLCSKGSVRYSIHWYWSSMGWYLYKTPNYWKIQFYKEKFEHAFCLWVMRDSEWKTRLWSLSEAEEVSDSPWRIWRDSASEKIFRLWEGIFLTLISTEKWKRLKLIFVAFWHVYLHWETTLLGQWWLLSEQIFLRPWSH